MVVRTATCARNIAIEQSGRGDSPARREPDASPVLNTMTFGFREITAMARSILTQERQAVQRAAAVNEGNTYVQNGTELTARRGHSTQLSGKLHSDKTSGWSAYDTFQFPRNGVGALFPGKSHRDENGRPCEGEPAQNGRAAEPVRNISHNYTWYAACLCLVTHTAAA